MTRPGVTYIDVAKIAQQLTAGGHEPTIERVRIQLKTGSNSTIGNHLRVWRTKQDPLQQLATKEKIPEELIVLLKGLWERVMTQAETQMEAIKNDAQQDLAQYTQTIQQLQQTNARLQQSELQLKRACAGLGHERSTLEQLNTEYRTDIAAIQARHEGLTQQLADKQTRVEELKKESKQTQANLEHYRAASLEQRQVDQQRSEQRERELTQNLQQLKMDNEGLREQKIDLQQLHDQQQSVLNNAQAELLTASQHAKIISTELIETNKILAQKSESERHVQTQHDKVYARWEDQMKLTGELQMQNAVLSQQIATMKMELTDVSDQNKMLAHDKWTLGQEKAQLFGQVKQLQAAL